jgi:putative peptide zinc metalloprotease protein
MSSLRDSLRSSSARKLNIRKRADLTAQKQYYLGQTYYVVKEPIGLNYFRFQEEEYAILEMLDGEMSMDDIKERFEAEYPPQKIPLEELQSFLGMLHRSGLVVSGAPGQGKELRKRRGERVRQKLLMAFANILGLRFKGFDPERLLNWMHSWLGWFFGPTAFFCFLILMLSAASLVAVEFDYFRSKLPEFHQFFGPRNIFWMAVVLAVTKVFHEFGHGLSCKHFGGECHEIGFMLLVLTPCLYCNVSDSWMLPSKWHRAAIGAAGMYVELIIASIATFIWWGSSPGLLKNLCLDVMFVSSVSTLIFNANPLLRYDGYYILADLAEIPNLRQKSTMILSRKMSEWFLGLEPDEDPFLPKQNQIFFAAYSIASAFYRWFIVLSIMLFLYEVWKPYRLEIIGSILGMMSLYGLLIYPLYKAGKFLYVPGRLDKVKMPHVYATAGGLVLLAAGLLFLPLPCNVFCSLEIQARDAAPVYVEVPGKLEKLYVRAGHQVAARQPLAEMSSIDLQIEIDELTAKHDGYVVQLNNLHQQRYLDRKAGDSIPAVEDALKTTVDQLKQRQADLARLQLRAPIAGTVLPPPAAPHREDPEGGQLPAWSGSLLEPENQGAHLERNTLFCQIGNPQQMEAILVVDQADIELVREGQKVDIKLQELPLETLHGAIKEIANIDLKVTPQRLSVKSGGDLATVTDKATGAEHPANVSYQARVPVDDAQRQLLIGLRGQAKIHAQWQSLGQRFWRFITHTFNFRM